jgi:hypothetical protein
LADSARTNGVDKSRATVLHDGITAAFENWMTAQAALLKSAG